MSNIILSGDSYKFSHAQQYPPGTTAMFSYIEARGGDFDRVLFFGLQAALIEYLLKPVTVDDVLEAEALCSKHGVPFTKHGWMYIAQDLHGVLPVRIKAVPEGSKVPTGNVLCSIESTDPKVFWVASFLETMLLRAIWYPTTVATVSSEIKQVIAYWLDKTSDDPTGQLPFKLHDFGCRGVSSLESAALGGLAHLVNFMGTDTVPALIAGRKYYSEECAGYSIPAAEHSTITSWGREREVDAYANMLDQYAHPGAIVAVVSDSYDIYHAVRELWGGSLKQKVVDSGASVVIRPDSGDPLVVVPHIMSVLADKFGYTTNSKGYAVLNNVRVIQGDGVDIDLINRLLHTLVRLGFSADNIAFGMGGALLQKLDRDTCSFAMKCSAVRVDGEWVDVFKQPITQATKASKGGRLMLQQHGADYRTVKESMAENTDGWHNALDVVYENGELKKHQTFSDVRRLASN